MIKFAILFALVAAATADPIRLDVLNPTGRIVGGVDTTIENAPHQISLQILGSHTCGGSIIAADWILTAAHCLSWPASWYTIRSGSTLRNSGGTVSNTAAIILHENYFTANTGIPHHDIALIRLTSPLTFSSSQSAIAMFSAGQEAVAGVLATITGWGNLVEGGSSPNTLQSVTLPIVSKASCSASYIAWGGIPAGQICAGVPEGGLSSCQGDSGGPVTINGAVAGIVAWGLGCARPGFPSVYTEVASYRQWIATNSGV